jgi:hypothetical protein
VSFVPKHSIRVHELCPESLEVGEDWRKYQVSIAPALTAKVFLLPFSKWLCVCSLNAIFSAYLDGHFSFQPVIFQQAQPDTAFSFSLLIPATAFIHLILAHGDNL